MDSYIQAYLAAFKCILDTMIHKMTSAPLNQSISFNFISQMSPHHAAAIQMSHNILIYSCNHKLKSIAQNIITTQTKGIQEMADICSICRLPCNQPSEVNCYNAQIQQIMQHMFSNMGHAYLNQNLDADFMRQMIPHHQGAVSMAKTALQYPICHQLQPILKTIITTQEQGIQEMCQLLNNI